MLALLYIIIIVAWVVLMMVLKCRMPNKCTTNNQDPPTPYGVQSVHVIQIDRRNGNHQPTDRRSENHSYNTVWAQDNHGFHGDENTAHIFPTSNIIFSSEPPTYEEAIKLPPYMHRVAETTDATTATVNTADKNNKCTTGHFSDNNHIRR